MQGDHIGSLYSYVVRSDSGFAPNPFGDYCTLACCKPQIRRHASVGDWVVGSGSKRTVGHEKMVFAMRITEKLSFDEYANDPRFRYKIPSQGIIQERGDNIYFKDQHGDWKQRPSYHTEKQMKADLCGEYVLISDHFFYFGANAVLVPERFRRLMSTGRWYRHVIGSEVADFVRWLLATYSPGIHGQPYVLAWQAVNRESESPQGTRYQIANIVAYTEIGESLNLTQLSQTLTNTEYDPEIYFALIYRIDDPKISVLVNKSGKIIFTGGKAMEDIERARDIFFHDLKVTGYAPLEQQIYIQNMVAVYDLSRRINLQKLIQRNQSKGLNYDPNRFRAVYLKNQDPRFTATINATGKIIILGAKSLEAIQSAIRIVSEVVNHASDDTK